MISASPYQPRLAMDPSGCHLEASSSASSSEVRATKQHDQDLVRRKALVRQKATLDRRVDEGRRTTKALRSGSAALRCVKAFTFSYIFRGTWHLCPVGAESDDPLPSMSVAGNELIAHSSTNSLPLDLTWQNLVSASVIVLASSTLLAVRWAHMKLAKDIAVACLRCFLQLQLIGGILLTQYLVVSQSHAFLVLLWIVITGILAAAEAKSRVEHTYPQMTKHLSIALLTAAGVIMGAAAVTRVFGEVRPWFAPRIWIPVSGMLFGNALTACGLAMSTWTREFVTRRASVEWRLCRGASWREALASPLRLSFTAAMTPVVNSLSVTGLIQLPGMMTGQILAGQSPYQAAAYQVIIFFLIAAFSLVSVQTALFLAVRETVDKGNDRLLAAETITATRKICSFGTMSESSSLIEHVPDDHVESGKAKRISVKRRVSGSFEPTSAPRHVLSIDNLLVERTGARVSIDVYQGEWVGINGPSGAGKSQVLRTIVGLENVDRGSIMLRGVSMQNMTMPEWRRRVALVLQDRPSLEATPQQFYDEIRDFELTHSQNVAMVDPRSFLRSWGSSSALFDQPWTVLSGGEAQLAAIAITLSLQPDVLLLDESTNALDVQLSIRVENTIKNMGIPVLIVSHSPTQLDRVCDSVVEI